MYIDKLSFDLFTLKLLNTNLEHFLPISGHREVDLGGLSTLTNFNFLSKIKIVKISAGTKPLRVT